MKKNKFLSGMFAVFILFSTVGAAEAAIVTFNDKTNFLNQTGATSATGALPNLGAVASATVGDVTFTRGPAATALFIGRPGDDWTSLNPGNDIALSSPEDLNVDIAAPVFSTGFDFVEPDENSTGIGCNATCFDSTFEVTLKLGAAMVDIFSFNAPDNVLSFIGVWSDNAFDRLEIRDITGTIDNEYYGEFYTGDRSLSAIPVPAAVWLFGSALIGLLGISKRRKTA